MNSFYIEGCGEAGRLVQLKSEDARHAALVMRMKHGDSFCAVDEAGERFLAVMQEISKEACTALLQESMPDNEAPVRITLYQGLPKAEKLEFLSQKLTELGVARLIPVRMERSIAKADGDKRMDRLARIAHEAVKQCRRAKPMEICPPMTWKDAVGDMEKRELMIVPWENASAVRMADIRAEFPDASDIGILIGPEGGISQGEIDSAPARPVLLGPRILRAETAAVTAVALAMAMWGDI